MKVESPLELSTPLALNKLSIPRPSLASPLAIPIGEAKVAPFAVFTLKSTPYAFSVPLGGIKL